MKTLKMLMVPILFLGIAGCKTTAQDTIAEAGKALQKNDLNHFKKLLSGDALKQYGTPDGMKVLKGKLGNLNLVSGDEVVVWTDGPAICTTVHTDYTIPVYNQTVIQGQKSQTEIFSAYLKCTYVENCHSGWSDEWCTIDQVNFSSVA